MRELLKLCKNFCDCNAMMITIIATSPEKERIAITAIVEIVIFIFGDLVSLEVSKKTLRIKITVCKSSTGKLNSVF